RDLGDVIGRTDFDHVHADDVQAGQAAHQAQGVVAAEAADHRRAGARREGRIEEIDVEADVALAAADPFADGGDGGVDTDGMQFARVHDPETVRLRVVRAHAQLDRAGRIHQAQAGGVEEHGA